MITPHELPRLLAGRGSAAASLREHTALFPGAMLNDAAQQLESSGLLGRGGAGFETYRKVALIRSQRGSHKVVVVNAMEGEPAAHKDSHLLQSNPHLVLDGAEALAAMIHADRIVVCVARDNIPTINAVQQAIHERQRRSLRAPDLSLVTPPGRYVAGEESALIHWLNDNESLPQFRPEKPHVLKLRRHAVLLDNAETCAHVGLISRYGAQWFRGLGPANHPGSTLVSVSGAVQRAKVLEVANGTPVREILAAAGADPSPQGIVVGGYGGVFLGPEILELPYAHESFRPYGANVGAGILAPISYGTCGLRETYRVAAWMAHESARQCGPCAFGLPAMAEDLRHIVHATADAALALDRLHARTREIEGRGACRHPDGVVRFIRSALTTFATDVQYHLTNGACAGVRAKGQLIVPTLVNEEELQWD
jgi:NADH:ubiquinone oxidoreductase subunit F (NADH-binding)